MQLKFYFIRQYPMNLPTTLGYRLEDATGGTDNSTRDQPESFSVTTRQDRTCACGPEKMICSQLPEWHGVLLLCNPLGYNVLDLLGFSSNEGGAEFVRGKPTHVGWETKHAY